MKKFKKGVDRRVILRYNNTTASENTKQTKEKNKKTSKKSVDKQNTTKYNDKGFAAQEKQTKSVWRGVRVV